MLWEVREETAGTQGLIFVASWSVVRMLKTDLVLLFKRGCKYGHGQPNISGGKFTGQENICI